MNCPNCENNRLDVMHVFHAGDSAETRDLKCRKCGFKALSVTYLMERPQERVPGKGALALSLQVQSGKVTPPKRE